MQFCNHGKFVHHLHPPAQFPPRTVPWAVWHTPIVSISDTRTIKTVLGNRQNPVPGPACFRRTLTFISIFAGLSFLNSKQKQRNWFNCSLYGCLQCLPSYFTPRLIPSSICESKENQGEVKQLTRIFMVISDDIDLPDSPPDRKYCEQDQLLVRYKRSYQYF